jgi:hypothetical protein
MLRRKVVQTIAILRRSVITNPDELVRIFYDTAGGSPLLDDYSD